MLMHLGLPQDMIVEILSRLRSVKSLMRFKCVSKVWLSLISDPDFAVLHLKQVQINTSPKLLLYRKRAYGFQSLDCLRTSSTFGESVCTSVNLDFNHPLMKQMDIYTSQIVKMIGSCNGLVCIGLATMVMYELDDVDLYIWNPSTRVCRKLPTVPISCTPYQYHFGFGYDLSTHDYKVVAVSEDKDTDDSVVFTAKTNSWREIKEEERFNSYYSQPECKYLNGTLYWLFHEIGSQFVFIAFDLAKEKFRRLPMPPNLDNVEAINFNSLGVVRGSLFLHHMCPHTNDFQLWVMKEYGVWEKLTAFAGAAKFEDNDRIMWFTGGCETEEDEVIISLSKDYHNGEDRKWYLVKSNIAKESKPERFTLNSSPGGFDRYDALDYVETLISPN